MKLLIKTTLKGELNLKIIKTSALYISIPFFYEIKKKSRLQIFEFFMFNFNGIWWHRKINYLNECSLNVYIWNVSHAL